MSQDITIKRASGSEGTINITVDISRAVLERLQKEGRWTEPITQEQVSGDGPVIDNFAINVS